MLRVILNDSLFVVSMFGLAYAMSQMAISRIERNPAEAAIYIAVGAIGTMFALWRISLGLLFLLSLKKLARIHVRIDTGRLFIPLPVRARSLRLHIFASRSIDAYIGSSTCEAKTVAGSKVQSTYIAPGVEPSLVFIGGHYRRFWSWPRGTGRRFSPMSLSLDGPLDRGEPIMILFDLRRNPQFSPAGEDVEERLAIALCMWRTRKFKEEEMKGTGPGEEKEKRTGPNG